MPAQPELQKQLQSIEQLLGTVEAAADPRLKAAVRDVVQILVNLHGEGLERMLEPIREAGESGEAIVQRLGADELVSSLFVLYGLHPVDLEGRVNHALHTAQSRLRAREGEAGLLAIENGTVRLRLRASSHDGGSSAEALKEIVEEALYQWAPDVTGLVIESADTRRNFVPLGMLEEISPPNAQAGL